MRDCDRFSNKVGEILSCKLDNKHHFDELFQSDVKFRKIENTFSYYLKPWFDAINELSKERLNHDLKNIANSQHLARFTDVNNTMKLILRIRRTYIALEIVAPVLFALITIGLVNLT